MIISCRGGIKRTQNIIMSWFRKLNCKDISSYKIIGHLDTDCTDGIVRAIWRYVGHCGNTNITLAERYLNSDFDRVQTTCILWMPLAESFKFTTGRFLNSLNNECLEWVVSVSLWGMRCLSLKTFIYPIYHILYPIYPTSYIFIMFLHIYIFYLFPTYVTFVHSLINLWLVFT